MKPHKHAELIKAWAEGAIVQRKIIRTGENIDEPLISYSWLTENMPMWSIHEEYRIKPERKPDVTLYSIVHRVTYGLPCSPYASMSAAYAQPPDPQAPANLKLTFDGETGELKSAEVIK